MEDWQNILTETFTRRRIRRLSLYFQHIKKIKNGMQCNAYHEPFSLFGKKYSIKIRHIENIKNYVYRKEKKMGYYDDYDDYEEKI